MNEVKHPAIYKHFKGEYYTTMGVSKPVSKEYFEAYLEKNKLELWQVDFLWCIYTETGTPTPILKIDGEYKHFFEPKKELVIYKDLYSDKGPYVRDLDMFLSKVDKNIYPQATQNERFKLIAL